MSASVTEIRERYVTGLLSRTEARDALCRIENRARFDRDYSDTLAGYKRFDRLADNARAARCAI